MSAAHHLQNPTPAPVATLCEHSSSPSAPPSWKRGLTNSLPCAEGCRENICRALQPRCPTGKDQVAFCSTEQVPHLPDRGRDRLNWCDKTKTCPRQSKAKPITVQLPAHRVHSQMMPALIVEVLREGEGRKPEPKSEASPTARVDQRFRGWALATYCRPCKGAV